MRSLSRSVAPLLAATLVLAAQACSTSSDDGGEAPPATTPQTDVARYRGIVALDTEQAVFELAFDEGSKLKPRTDPAPSPAVHGTFRTTGGATYTIDGTWDPATRQLSASVKDGGGVERFSATGTVDAEGHLAGELRAGGATYPLHAAGVDVDDVELFCGHVTGSVTGSFGLLTAGRYAAGALAADVGLLVPAQGTRTGSSFALTVGTSGEATGQFLGDGVAGRWSYPAAGGATLGGELFGSRTACPALDGTGAGGSDAGTDASADDASADASGSDASGSDASGSDASGSDASGSDASGSDASGSDAGDAGGSDAGDAGGADGSGGQGGTGGSGGSGGSGGTGGSGGSAGSADCPSPTIASLDASEVVQDLEADGGWVYWSSFAGPSTKDLHRAPRVGGATTVLASDNLGMGWIAAENGRVCFTSIAEYTAVSCVDGAGGTPVLVSTQQHQPQNLRMSAGWVYWTVGGSVIVRGKADGSVGTATEPVFDVYVDDAHPATAIDAIAVYDPWIYMAASRFDSVNGVYAYSYWRIPAGAQSGLGNPVTAESLGPETQDRTMRVAADAQGFYWRTAGNRLVAWDPTGQGGGALVDPLLYAGAIAARDGMVWWGDGGNLLRTSMRGTHTPVNLGTAYSTSASGPDPIAVDDRCVYWFGLDQGRKILSAPR